MSDGCCENVGSRAQALLDKVPPCTGKKKKLEKKIRKKFEYLDAVIELVGRHLRCTQDGNPRDGGPCLFFSQI